MRIISANVNGIRAAARRGGITWLAAARPDVICMQEVRATPEQLAATLSATPLRDWEVSQSASERPGHAGVAILTRPGLREGVPDGAAPALPGKPSEQGRWAQVGVPAAGPGVPGGTLEIATAYVHTGAPDGPAWRAKEDFLGFLDNWLAAHDQRPALLTGDLNVAHTEADIKNWRGNRGKPGFLASERSHLDRWFAAPPQGLGWIDLGRRFGGHGPGPYTWWSWRGRGFDTDGGWRIDYAIASAPLAPAVNSVAVAKAETYAQRWSDHAPLLVDLGARRDPGSGTAQDDPVVGTLGGRVLERRDLRG